MAGATKLAYFASSTEFRNWLQNNHHSRTELFVGFYKRSSGKPGITYSEALDEALCCGWIDGVRKRVDDEAYMIRFAPRKAKSQWSAVNIRRAQQLSAAGRMYPCGLKALQGADEQKRKYSYEQPRESRLPNEDEQRFRGNSSAWEFFQSQPSGYRKTATFWVVSAKRVETRQRRLGILISASENNRRIDLLAPLSVPKRQKNGSTEAQC